MDPHTRSEDQQAERNNEIRSAPAVQSPQVSEQSQASGERARVTSSVDHELIAQVRAAGAGSELAGDLEKTLQDLGFGTLVTLQSKGQLFRQLNRLRIYLLSPPMDFKREFRALAFISVSTASPIFMGEYVFGGKWDASRASLHTCFVNACLCQFAVEYRRYCNEERRTWGEEPDFEEQYEPDFRQHHAPRPPPDPQAQTVNRAEIERLLAVPGLTAQDKLMFIRTAQGWTQAEIAEELGLTEHVVSARMRRNRQKIAKHRRDGEIHGTTSGT